MKRMLIILCVIVLVLAFASCSSGTVTLPPQTITQTVTQATTQAVTQIVTTSATTTAIPTMLTTTSPQTTTPSPGYSRSTPVGIGVPLTAKIDNTGGAAGIFGEYTVRLTLLEVIRGAGAWQLIYAANRYNDPPKAGFEYILVRMRFEYLTGPTADSTYYMTSSWFDTVSSSGSVYDNPSIVDPDPSFDCTLYPGASHEGWMTFQVAQTDATPLATIGRNYDGTGGIWFKLY